MRLRGDREYYLNDRGTQMRLFARIARRRARPVEPVPADGYQGDYIKEWAAEMPDGADPAGWGYERVRRDLATTLARMGVEFDVWFSEQSLVDSHAVEATLDDLREPRGVVYDADGAMWLRTTDFGDDKDRVLVKSDGEPTYLLPDIAYHRDKFARGLDLLIDVWGADHHGYVARSEGGHAGPRPRPGRARDHPRPARRRSCVTASRCGCRSGPATSSMLDDLLDAVGPDVARLTFLLQSIDSRQTVDLDVITRAVDGEPGLLRADGPRPHRRHRPVAPTEVGVERLPLAESTSRCSPTSASSTCCGRCPSCPRSLRLACDERAPHKVTTWVRELADRFHGFYHDCYVIGEGVPPELTQARLWLVESARVGLAIGLDLLGVSAPESM